MADFVLSSGNTVRPHRSPWGAFPVKGYKLSTGLSSNQIFIGSLVVLDQASTAFGDCVIKASVSSATLNPPAASIVGISAETPSSAVPGSGINPQSTTPGAQGSIMVWEANPNVEFKAWTRGGLITSTIVGTIRELTRDTTLNIDLVRLAGASALATPAPCVIVTQIADGFASGDSGGAVIFRFNTSSGFLAFYR